MSNDIKEPQVLMFGTNRRLNAHPRTSGARGVVAGDTDSAGFVTRDKVWVSGRYELLMFRAKWLSVPYDSVKYVVPDISPELALTHSLWGGPPSVTIVLGGGDSHEFRLTQERARHLAEILLVYADTGNLIDPRRELP